ncbi:inositol monophosphatase family protein [Corynebacterium sp. sy017]|uniref:inositol monophosphatase family protein n=1 Tax=unclassified Corynebacterium TaxID=2624378 RepID=UPI0011853534|nr:MULTISPECIES: inositol monophosphatase family protein [unclassified Corynebacterium]MBP3088769.1 inositol monophosphatase family protein [Corynebacterium sp. sy017]TSD92050.1 inositol monophosphatase family protein [Corynebacterium sp. SY003]
MTNDATHPDLETFVAALAKTFVISHQDDTDAHLAQALVFNAARLAWRLREQGVAVEHKTSISDVVTNADRAAEQFVTSVLEQLRPNDGILGEEGTAKASTSGRTWVIDPVDGTYNFAAASDYWCSALALIDGEPTHPTALHFGAVHRPDLGYTWFGGPDIPTTFNGKEVASLSEQPCADISFATYIHPTALSQPEIAQPWQALAESFAALRMLGAGSVDLAQVAQGNLGAWAQHSVPAWDWLPGAALIQGAGGAAEQVGVNGIEWSLAGNKQVVAEMLRIIEQAKQQ